MKLWLIVISIFLLAFTVYANNMKEPETQNVNVPEERIDVPHALLRGVTNVGTFWLEVPRKIVVDSNYNPVYGVPVGAIKGAYYGALRLIYGTFDIALLGFTGPSGFSAEFPEYVWDAQWNPWPKKEEEPE